jgi:hypothetical protein
MSNFTDVVGGYTLYFGSGSYSYTYNQLCSSNAATYLTNCTIRIPTGTFISGDFTLIYWLYMYPTSSYQSLIYFGFTSSNYIYAGVNQNSASKLQLMINTTQLLSSSAISTYKWYHVAYTVSGTTATLYINGYSNLTATVTAPISISRSNNFIGGGTVNAILSGIKLYSGEMTATSIYTDYLSSSNNGIENAFILYSYIFNLK